jgi:hypothetical protein
MPWIQGDGGREFRTWHSGLKNVETPTKVVAQGCAWLPRRPKPGSGAQGLNTASTPVSSKRCGTRPALLGERAGADFYCSAWPERVPDTLVNTKVAILSLHSETSSRDNRPWVPHHLLECRNRIIHFCVASYHPQGQRGRPFGTTERVALGECRVRQAAPLPCAGHHSPPVPLPGRRA